jgi:Fe2+ transport system protein FeoA
MPLIIAPIGQTLKVVKLLTDLDIQNYLKSLGITVNTNINVVSKNDSNIICLVNETKIVLDNDIAQKIFVA